MTDSFKRQGTFGRLQLLGILLFCFQALPVQAQAPAIYDVEIIVFLNLHPDDAGEQWPAPAMPREEAFESAFPPGEFTELTYSFYQLKGITESLQNSRNYKVLLHRAWRQLAYDRKNAVPYPLESVAGDDRDSIAGSVKLVRERFLHLDVDVLLMSNQGGNRAGGTQAAPPVPTFALQEVRRIRSNELHYFDHPYLGMIAQVTPYVPAGTPPEQDEDIQPESGSATPEVTAADTAIGKLLARSVFVR